MRSSKVTPMSAGLLLIALIGQVGSLKLAKHPAAVAPAPAQPTVHQQEEAILNEQLQQQRQFELLQQQQRQAEYQIQQQQLEAQRLIGQPLLVPQQQQRHESASGIKGAPLSSPPPAAAYYDRQQYAPPRSTIAYLVVRPPYPALLPYDESAYRNSLPPLARPQAYPVEYPKQAPVDAYGPASIKGGRQEELPPPPPQPQPPVQPDQPALIVPVSADKHGKLKAILDKIMSKLSFSSYEVAGEEYVYPTPSAASVKQEAPIVQQQQPIEQQQIQQVREEEQQPAQIQQQPIQQQPIQQQPIQQQQQQTPVQEQERDQGFDEPVKSSATAAGHR